MAFAFALVEAFVRATKIGNRITSHHIERAVPFEGCTEAGAFGRIETFEGRTEVNRTARIETSEGSATVIRIERVEPVARAEPKEGTTKGTAEGRTVELITDHQCKEGHLPRVQLLQVLGEEAYPEEDYDPSCTSPMLAIRYSTV